MSRINVDFLVLGSGVAGLTYALKAANYGTVAIVTKKQDVESNTNYAQGGIASVFGEDDSFDLHIKDTLDAGRGICKVDAVETMVKEGPRCINELVKFGAEFTLSPDSAKFDLGKEGGHSRKRIVHAKDYTGNEVERILTGAAHNHPNIQVYENHTAIDLLTEHQVRSKTSSDDIMCYGAYVYDEPNSKVRMFTAKITLLSTGGAGQVYLHTTNPRIATGDGMAMAYRAKAKLANLEFMQFHPTTLFYPEADAFLISEAVRGAGAILLDKDGRRFMEDYDPKLELAPRDVVARAIDAEMKKRGDSCVYLDLSPIGKDDIPQNFPQIYNKCLEFKLDITQELVPVVPAAHYMCGGVYTDLYGQTSIKNLFACGEVAYTGVHGANRLASNSLLEALVYADRAATLAKDSVKEISPPPEDIEQWDVSGTFNMDEWVLIAHDREEIRKIMWDYVGIVRSNFRLTRAKRRIDIIRREVREFYRKTTITEELLELRNISTVAQLIIESALMRKESRGLHYTTDYSGQDDVNYLGETVVPEKLLD
ncbi:MAG: L-aspartate oxidase [bacterium]|nr:L-aspartate oxidase [bacterium]